MIASELDIAQAVQMICHAYTQTPIDVIFLEKVRPDDWGRHCIWRYQVQSHTADFPDTVIVKISNIGAGHIFNEWASLEFLNSFDEIKPFVPDFYGGNPALELLVMQDLGAVRDQTELGNILEGNNATLAQEALLAYARHMALLHITTAQHEAVYRATRERFPAYNEPLTKDQFTENFAWFKELLIRLDIPITPLLDADIQAIVHQLTRHDAVRAYLRGDVCPSNVAYPQGQMLFYDFEMGAYRNIFLSAAYFRLSHLSCINGSLIPVGLQAEAEQVYFEALAPMFPDAIHQVDYAAAASAMLIWIWKIYFDKKNRPRHIATHRQRMFAALTLFIKHEPFTKPYPHLSASLRQLHAYVTKLWDAEDKNIAPFVAFHVR